MTEFLLLTGDSLPVSRAIDFVQDDRAGGVAIFLGTSRAETSGGGDSLVALDYEAYPEMVGRQFADFARRARERWPMILKLALLHRTGKVFLKEPSVLVGVSTPHRGEAFEACRWLIDTLKAEASIWKREVWQDGSGDWVGQ